MKKIILMTASLLIAFSSIAHAKKIVLFSGKTTIKAGHEKSWELPGGISQFIQKVNVSGVALRHAGIGRVETQNTSSDVHFPKVDPNYNLAVNSESSFVSVFAPNNANLRIYQVTVTVSDEVVIEEPTPLPPAPRTSDSLCDTQYGNVIAEISCRMRKNAQAMLSKANYAYGRADYNKFAEVVEPIIDAASDTVLKARGYQQNNAEGVSHTAKSLACSVYKTEKFLKRQGLVEFFQDSVDNLRVDYYKLQQAIGPQFTTYMRLSCHGYKPLTIGLK